MLQGSLFETLESLDMVYEASRFDMKDKAFYVEVGEDLEYEPYSIFPNRSAAEACSEVDKGMHDITTVVDVNHNRTRGQNLTELLEIAQSLPYSDLLLELREYSQRYISCTSYYKDFVDGLMSWRQSINITGQIEYGTQFIFEKEAKSVMEDKQWLMEQIYLPYVQVSDMQHIDGFVQERRNPSALAMELRLSCTNPSM